MIAAVPVEWNALQVCSSSKDKLIGREIERLYALSDRWLAEALLRLSRSVHEKHRDYLSDTKRAEQSHTLINKIVPEVARRLGATRFRPGEGSSILGKTSNLELRRIAATCLVHSDIASLSFINPSETYTAEEILGVEIENGNPLIFALDRICEVTKRGSKKDWVSRHISMAAIERGQKPSLSWNPEMGWQRKQG